MSELSRRRMLGLLPVWITVPVVASRPVLRGDHTEVTVTAGEPEIEPVAPPILIEFQPGEPLSAAKINELGRQLHQCLSAAAATTPRIL